MNLVLAKSETARASGDVFAAARERLPGSGLVADARAQAYEAFQRVGLPHRRIEEWKYTDLRAMMSEVLPPAAEPDATALARAARVIPRVSIAAAARLVLVDGVFAPGLSELPTDRAIGVRRLRDVLVEAANPAATDLLSTTSASDPMIALNAALVTDGLVLTIGDEVVVDRPVHILHVATASRAGAYTRSQLRLGQRSGVKLLESFVATDDASAYQVNDALIVRLGDGAELSHVRLMRDAGDAVNVSSSIVTAGSKAKLNLFTMTAGGAVSRYQGFLTLSGEGTDLSINGVNLLGGKQHGDTTLVVDHAAPHCTSRENFRAVVDGRGHSVFQGRIIVRQDAQKTDGKMMTRALLLSDEAEADNKPELEIFADDVSCGHGATTGALDESLLFYLRARGLPEGEAQALLIQAFLGEAIEQIADDELRDLVAAEAAQWLEVRG